MDNLKNKIAIAEEVFTVETKENSGKVDILIYANDNENAPIFQKNGYIINNDINLEEIHSKVLGKFIKLYKKSRGNLNIVKEKLEILLDEKLPLQSNSSDTNSNNHSDNTQSQKTSSIPAEIILKSCNHFLDDDISAIVVAENENVIFIGEDSISDKKKVLKALQCAFQIARNNIDKIQAVIGDMHSIYLYMSECHIVIYPINRDRMCMIISKNGSIGNLFKKSEYILQHSKELFKNYL